MKLASLAIAEQDALVRAGVAALRDLDDDDDVDISADGIAVDVADPDVDADREDAARSAWRLLTDRLSGAAALRRHLDDLRRDHGEDALLVALSAVADALVAALKARKPARPQDVTDADVALVLRARAEARQLLTNPRDAPATTIPQPAPSLSTATARPGSGDPGARVPPTGSGRSAVAAALDSLIDQPPVSDDDVPVPAGPGASLGPGAGATALLRVRALTAAAARSLAAVSGGVVDAADITALPHAADELLLSARGADRDAVALLVRAASSIANGLPEGAPLSFALVKGSGDAVADVVRAGSILPRAGLLALDDGAAGLAPDLAIVPGTERAVDARAPWGEERWELSALLMRPPFVGRDDDVKACSDVLARAQAPGGRGSGSGRLLVLWGPPGVGKSSLVRASLSEAGLLDERAVVLWGAADPLQPTPYAAVVGMIRALARAPAGHPRATARITTLVEGLALELAEPERGELQGLKDVVVDLVGAGADDDDDDLAERRSTRALRTSIRRALLLLSKALLAKSGDERPAVFVVSGAEAMDAPTRETLVFLARRLGDRARIVLLASQKPRFPPGFEDGLDVTRREVKPLDARSARALCRALLDVNGPHDADLMNETTAESPGGGSNGASRGRGDASIVDANGALLDAAVDALFERAKGSPLFVAHAVRWAVEGGFLKKSSGVLGGTEWDASLFHEAEPPARDGARGPSNSAANSSSSNSSSSNSSSSNAAAARLPTRLDKLLHARVLRLPDTARRVLGHCAALGLTFLPAAVEYVGVHLGLTRDEVERAVRLLTETGFLARSQRRPGAPVFADDDVGTKDAPGAAGPVVGDDALLVFEHPLLRAAAEQALNDDEVKAVHGVVADALEALLDTRAVAPMLARHHKKAERRRQALQHLVVAVRRARRLDDRQGAITMAKEALELCTADEKETIFTLQLELCAVLEHGNNEKAFKDALKQLVRAADKTGDPKHQATAFARVARFNLFAGDVDKAEEAALRALEKARAPRPATSSDAPSAPSSALSAALPATSPGGAAPRGPRDVLRLLALIRFARRDLDGAHRALDEARRLTADTDRRVQGVIEHQTGLFRLESNDPLGALEHLLLARSHKRATADLAGEAACLDAIADVYLRMGRLWSALSLLVRALSIREAIGDDAGFAQSLKSRADVLLMAGDVDAAKAEAQRARTLAKGLSLDRLEHQAAIVVARTALANDDAAAAEGILDNVRRRVDLQRDPFAAMEAELLSARAKWMRAQQSSGGARDRLLKTALARARAAVDIGEQRGFLSGQVLGNALLGDVLVSSGDAGKALPYAQRAAELLDDRQATALPIEDALGSYARVLRAVGDDDEADAALRRARGLLEERARRLPLAMQERFWSVPTRRALRDLPPLVTMTKPTPTPTPTTAPVPSTTDASGATTNASETTT